MKLRFEPVLSRVVVLALAGAMAFTARPALANHVGCGDVLTHDTTLDSDLLACPGDGLVVGADNITVDLGGHTVDGTDADDSVGVRNDGHDGARIENGIVQGFERGVFLIGGAARNRVRDLTVRDNSGDGIALGDARRNRISGNTTTLNGSGVVLRGSSDNWITNNRVDDNRINGILLDDSAGNLVRRNDVFATGALGGIGGIALLDADENSIEENLVVGTVAPGISLRRSTENVIRGNDLVVNKGGIVLFASTNNLIEENQSGALGSDGNDGPGIALHEGSGDNRLRRNTAAENAGDGILIESGSSGNRLERNIADHNFGDGIHVDDPGTTASRNTADNNGDLGIEAVAGVTDGGGNQATGNGNPAQCVNVSCS